MHHWDGQAWQTSLVGKGLTDSEVEAFLLEVQQDVAH